MMSQYSIDGFFGYLLQYAYYYPLFMAYLWMVGGVYYRFHWENEGGRAVDDPPTLEQYPSVSFVVPCHNEGDTARDTIRYLLDQDYPDFEIVVINDGSTDNTAEVLDVLAHAYPAVRVIHLAQNQGKAMALNIGSLMAKHQFLVCVDGDALLDRHASKWLMRHFIYSPRLGAVTGNPRIRNRTSILGKLQIGEFSSIIGLIKRAQRIYGRVFTVSGVVVALRKSALHRVNYWNLDIVTEDIDISWRLQLDHWDIRYEPNALCWLLMPETLSGLFKQRIRWAQGGAETFARYCKNFFSWRRRRMWPVFLEYMFSVAWSYAVLVILILWVLGKWVALPEYLYIPTIVPGWNGVVLGVTCLTQFLVSLFIDSRYEKDLLKYYFWMVWYPLAYWVINVISISIGIPKAIFKKRGRRAVWESPDRGFA